MHCTAADDTNPGRIASYITVAKMRMVQCVAVGVDPSSVHARSPVVLALVTRQKFLLPAVITVAAVVEFTDVTDEMVGIPDNAAVCVTSVCS